MFIDYDEEGRFSGYSTKYVIVAGSGLQGEEVVAGAHTYKEALQIVKELQEDHVATDIAKVTADWQDYTYDF